MGVCILNECPEAAAPHQDIPHRAVLVSPEWAQDKDIIAVEYFKEGSWHCSPGQWYADTLLGVDGNKGLCREDGISIIGDDWAVAGGMQDALKAYVRILIDQGRFMTPEREQIVKEVREKQQRIFGDFAVIGSAEDILCCYPSWGASDSKATSRIKSKKPTCEGYKVFDI